MPLVSAVALVLASSALQGRVLAATDTAEAASLAAEAADAYLFGYPLVVMDVSRQVMTAVPKADAHKAPINQFVHAQAFPDYTFTDVVSANADTLYSFAWLDLAQEPIVLSVPEMGERYYLMQLLGAWTDVFASPGSRTTGNGRGDFAIVGPRWTGTLPAGQPLSGANRYMLRFANGQLPPVRAFWSITMYNAKQGFVQNPIGRYAIGDRDPLVVDQDGSLTLYVQHESPGKDKESNWLPAPADSFNLFMRLYWPEQAIVDGTWKMPPVEKAR